jgi:SAM-dependent methyltransferase
MTANPLDRVATYFAGTIQKHGATAQGAGWRDQQSQELRFSKLIEVTRGAKTGRIVEVGCGWGAFALWAARQGFDFEYIGYDISPDMISAARSACENLDKASFEIGAGPFAPADWVIASGAMSVRLDIPDTEWRKQVDKTIDAMAQSARLGFAFNFLTGYSDQDRKESYLYYPYPGEMLDSVMSRHGRTAMLLHDYPLYEFTIVVYKLDERRRAGREAPQ